MSHPASSGTAYTIIAGLVQLMGEDAAFEYLKQVHKNTTAYLGRLLKRPSFARTVREAEPYRHFFPT